MRDRRSPPVHRYIEALLNETQRGVAQALPIMCRQLISRGLLMVDSIAAFLVLQGNYSYYSASTGWFDKDWVWHKEFGLVYGLPTADAKTVASPAGNVYHREFTHATVVSNCTGVGGGNCKGTITMKPRPRPATRVRP